MLVSRSRSSLKCVHSYICMAGVRKTNPLNTLESIASLHRRHASSLPQPRVQPNHDGVTPPIPFSARLAGFQGDTGPQTTMNRTSKARFTMQIMSEADRGYYHKCLAIASEMKASGIKPDLPIYTAMMAAAAFDASWLDAWAILDDMLAVGVKPDVAVCNFLIKAQQRRSSPYVWKAVEKMNELGIAPNATTFSHIILRYLDSGNLEMALQYLYAMKGHGVVPEFKTAQSVITDLAQFGYPKLAIDLINWFEGLSVRRIDYAVWMTCLISSAEALYTEGVVQCWGVVVHGFKMKPNEGICLSVLHTAARGGLPDLATDVLRILKLTGVAWEEHHFAPLIEAFSRKKQIKEALQALEIMRVNGTEPLTETAYPLLDVMGDTDTVDATWTVIDELHKKGKKIDPTVFHVLIKASVKLGDLQRAIGAYKSLADYGATPDLTIFNLLIEGCLTASHRGLGDLLIADMRKANVKPDRDTYQNFISLCLTQDDYEDAFFYLEEMKSAGYTPPSSVYETIIKKCLSRNDSRHKVALEEMQEMGYRPSSQLTHQLREASRTIQDRDAISNEPITLDGAAQRFIDTGGLSGAAELPKERFG